MSNPPSSLRLRGTWWTVVFLLGFCLTSCQNRDNPSKLPFGFLDRPVGGQAIHGNAPVSGWAISEDGIQSVEIYIDRDFVGRATIGEARPDVAKIYPNLTDSGSSGWSLTLDESLLSEGNHELTVQIRSKRGAYRDLTSIPITIVH
jgi:Bacterial Ig domain